MFFRPGGVDPETIIQAMTFQDVPNQPTPVLIASKSYRGVAVLGDDLYMTAYNEGMFKITNGAIGGTTMVLQSGYPTGTTVGEQIVVHPSGNVYCWDANDIYMQTGGAGAFADISAPDVDWAGMCLHGTDVYAIVDNGDLYKQTGGVGSFVAQGVAALSFEKLASDGTSLYSYTGAGDLYVRTNNTGDFTIHPKSLNGNWQALGSDNLNLFMTESTNASGEIWQMRSAQDSVVSMYAGVRKWLGASYDPVTGKMWFAWADGGVGWLKTQDGTG